MKNILLPALLVYSLQMSAQTRFYVHATATGAQTGQSWVDAFTDLQAALQAAQSSDEVWVAEGTYFPTSGTDRTISFEPVSGLRLYGGFAGTETSLAQRDWAIHPAVLSGDIGIAGDSTDNSRNVVYLFQPDSSTTIDGFTICFGVANDVDNSGSSKDRAICGGGLYMEAGNWDAFANIRHCRFWRNAAHSFGGGVMTNGATSARIAPKVEDCIFEDNRSLSNGGGLARFGGSWTERGVEFEGCTFVHNRAVYGAGLYYTDTPGPNKVSLHGCTFEGNAATLKGGGAYFQTGKAQKSGLDILKCTFNANTSIEGAAIDIFTNGNDFDGQMLLDSSIFIRNISKAGGAYSNILYADQLGTVQTAVVVKNTILRSNYAGAGIISMGYFNSKTRFNNIVFDQDTASHLLGVSLVSSSEISNSVFSSNKIYYFSSIDYYGNIGHFHSNNCLFVKNEGNPYLYEFRFQGIDSIFLKNCTFHNYNVQGLFASSSNNPNPPLFVCENLILSDKDASVYINTDHFYFDHCLLNLQGQDCSNLPFNATCGPGNLSGLNPMFRDTANGDYSLLPCSPLINAGSNAAASGLLTDITENPRIQEGRVDIGAYEAPAFSLAAIPEVKPACEGSSNGSITVNPVMGCEPYHYDWSPQAGNGPELNGLPPGDYLLTITDGSGRQILDTVQVASVPMPVLNPTVSDVQCITGLGGSISAGVSSGTAPFHYQWLPSAADTASLHYLSPGAYALTVVDANGCQDSAAASISLSGMLTLMVDGQGIPCYGETGWLSATPLTGAAPFHWLWQGWPGTDFIAQPLSPGVYAVTVSDTYGCTAAFAFPPMTQPDSLWATVGTSPQTDLNMPNGAAIVTTISGGTSPFGFDWNTGNTTQALTGIAAGTYTVTVKDKNGCEALVEVVVDLMVGTNEAEGQALLLYPNPAADWLRVVLPASSAAHWVELSDASGRVLRSALLPTLPAEVWTKAGATATANCQLNLQGLPAGGYWVRVRNGAGKELFMGKVLKM